VDNSTDDRKVSFSDHDERFSKLENQMSQLLEMLSKQSSPSGTEGSSRHEEEEMYGVGKDVVPRGMPSSIPSTRPSSKTSLEEIIASHSPPLKDPMAMEYQLEEEEEEDKADWEKVFTTPYQKRDPRRFSDQFALGRLEHTPAPPTLPQSSRRVPPPEVLPEQQVVPPSDSHWKHINMLSKAISVMERLGVEKLKEGDDMIKWMKELEVNVKEMGLGDQDKALVIKAFLDKPTMEKLREHRCLFRSPREVMEVMLKVEFGDGLVDSLPCMLFSITQRRDEAIAALCVRIDEAMDQLLYLFEGQWCPLDVTDPDRLKFFILKRAIKSKWFEAVNPLIKNGNIHDYLGLKEELEVREMSNKLKDSRRSSAQSVDEYRDVLNRPRTGPKGEGTFISDEVEPQVASFGNVRVKMMLGDEEVQVGVDSCSGVNLLPIELVEKHEWNITSSKKRIYGIGGWSKVVGKVVLPVTLSEDSTVAAQLTFFVVRSPLPYPLIGTQGQFALDICPDAGRSRVLTHQTTQSVSAQVINDQHPALLAVDVEIPPCAQMSLPIRLEGDEAQFFEPFSLQCGVLLEEGVTRGRVTVLNPKELPILLHAGTMMGTLSKPSTFAVIDVQGGGVTVESKYQDLGIDSYLEAGYERWTGRREESKQEKEIGLDLSHLDSRLVVEVESKVNEYSDVFGDGAELAQTPFSFQIDTGEAAPVNIPLRRVSKLKSDLIEAEVEKLLLRGLIEKSSSAWSSPVCLVRKPNGDFRFCVDYRALNAITITDSYPIPSMDVLLSRLEGAKYYTSLDLSQGFWQIGLDPSSKVKTAFRTESGLYQFNVLSMGLKNSPSQFQRCMAKVLAGLDDVVVYLDDVLIFSKGWQQHLRTIDKVLERFRTYKMILNPQKCKVACTKFKYLGVVLSEDGIQPDEEKVVALRERPSPVDKDGVRSWLGVFNYFSKFVAGISDKLIPISSLMKDEVEFVWGDEQERALRMVVEELCGCTLLRHPDYNKEFYLMTDASAHAMGVVLLQKVGEDFAPLYFWSRKFKPAETRYPTCERELLAIVEGLKRLEFLIWGHHIVVLSDHNPLKYLQYKEVPSDRLFRWALVLQNWDLAINYIKGSDNSVADFLSRPPKPEDVLLEIPEEVERTYFMVEDEGLNFDEVDGCCLWNSVEDGVLWTNHQPTMPGDGEVDGQKVEWDEFIVAMERLLNGEQLDDVSPALKLRVEKEKDCYVMVGGRLHRELLDKGATFHQFCVPSQLWKSIITLCHEGELGGGHMGFRHCYYKLKRQYYFPKMRSLLLSKIASCQQCDLFKSRKVGRGPNPIAPYLEPFEVIEIDFTGPIHPHGENGEKYIFVVTCLCSKWVEAFPTKDNTAQTAATILVNEIFCRYGLPNVVRCDNGVHFRAELFRSVVASCQARIRFGKVYFPEAQGQVERANRTIKNTLR